jgi:GT2 family glycosyltransferase
MVEPRDPQLFGVLVTHRRQDFLRDTLERLAEQDRRLDHLVVIDNEASDTTRSIVEGADRVAGAVEYLATSENLGFAGGVATGMSHVLASAEERDWIVLLDDDDPPPRDSTIGEVEAFATETLVSDPSTAAVGLTGGRFDRRRGRIKRIPTSELHGAVPVDYVAGGHVPFFLVRAVRQVGTFDRLLFFGLSEVEYGLRLRKAGYSLYAHGDPWRKARASFERSGKPTYGLSPLHWKRYYSLRNTVYVNRLHGRKRAALRVVAVHGFGKPLVNLPAHPILAWQHLTLNVRACFDGLVGRMGRRIEPDGSSKRDVAIRESTETAA